MQIAILINIFQESKKMVAVAILLLKSPAMALVATLLVLIFLSLPRYSPVVV